MMDVSFEAVGLEPETENVKPKRAYPDSDPENTPSAKRSRIGSQKKDPAEVEAKRKEREEAKRLREEKKRQKEHEKLEKEQKVQAAKAKVQRQSEVFKSFFHKVKTEEQKTWGWSNELFRPFAIKDKMVIAPVFLRQPLSSNEYDKTLSTTVEKSDYLEQISKVKRKRIVKDPLRAKYFHFHDNFRPPYYGTFRKVSKIITGRRPFALSHKELSYEVDSDAEWEEEQAEAGEDCLSDAEDGIKDDSSENSNDEFYVDHGYLSNNEGSEASNSEGENSQQRQRRMEHRAREFTNQRSNKTHRVKKELKVQIYGLNWQLPKQMDPYLEARLMKAVVFDFPRVTSAK